MGNMPVVEVGGRKVRVKRLLSEGGFAHVYKAVDEVNKKDYALKMVRIPRGRSGQLANEEVAEMAIMEQSVVRSLPTNHPNIVRFHDAGISKADSEIRYYILSEYCPSNVLRKMSGAQDQGVLLPEKDVLLIFRDTLMAVLYLHSRNPPIAHRDLKVDNLLVGRDGLIKLCDFGSCSTTHRSYYGAQDIAAADEEIRRNTTPAYRSPEQVDLFQGHRVTEKVDIWALGVMLFKLAFFHTPFEDVRGNVEAAGILNGLGDRKIPQEKHYSKGLMSLIRCCLVVDPEKRPSIGQVLKLCEELKNTGSLPTWPGLNTLPRTPPHSSSSPFSPRPWDASGGDSGSDRTSATTSATPHGGTPTDSYGQLLHNNNYNSNHNNNNSGSSNNLGVGSGGGSGASSSTHGSGGYRRGNDLAESGASQPRPYSDQLTRQNGRSQSGNTTRRSGPIGGLRTSSAEFGGFNSRGKTASVTASPRRSQKVTKAHTGSGESNSTWMARVKDGMQSRWYKLMGGEQRKRLWVLKTTSQSATGPKPKYVSKIVIALWENQLTMMSFFDLLRFRPLAESPIISMKALITLMKVLQQGPPHVLSECSTYAAVVDEIGQMWGAPSGGTGGALAPPPLGAGGSSGGGATVSLSLSRGGGDTSGAGGGGGGGGISAAGGSMRGDGGGGSGGEVPMVAVVDPALSVLIQQFSNMIVQKIRFHQHHPEYEDYWSPDTVDHNDTSGELGDAPTPQKLPTHDGSDEPRTLQVIKRLLAVQSSILITMSQAFEHLDKGNADAGPCTRSALLPLMAESYLTYIATTRVLLTVSEKYTVGGTRRGKARPDELVALSHQYDLDLKAMQGLYKRADEVDEVNVMKRTPRLPAVSPLSEGGAKQFREMSRKSSGRSTFGRASSKMEALKTLQDEERKYVGSNNSQKGRGALFEYEDNSDDSHDEDVDNEGAFHDNVHRRDRLSSNNDAHAAERDGAGDGRDSSGGSGSSSSSSSSSGGGGGGSSEESEGDGTGTGDSESGEYEDDDDDDGDEPPDLDRRLSTSSKGGLLTGRKAGSGSVRRSSGARSASSDGDDSGAWESGSENGSSPDGGGRAGLAKGKGSAKDLRLDLDEDNGEWSNYSTWQGPNSRAPSSGQARETSLAIRRPSDGGLGPHHKAWGPDDHKVMIVDSSSGSTATDGLGNSGGGGAGVIGFPQHPSPLTPTAGSADVSAQTRSGGTGSTSAGAHATTEVAQHSRRSSGTGDGAGAARGGAIASSRRHSGSSGGGGGGGGFEALVTAATAAAGGPHRRNSSTSAEAASALGHGAQGGQSSRRSSTSSVGESGGHRSDRSDGDRRRRRDASPPPLPGPSTTSSPPLRREGRDAVGGGGKGGGGAGADPNSPPAKPPDSSGRGRTRRVAGGGDGGGGGGGEEVLPAELPGLGSTRPAAGARGDAGKSENVMMSDFDTLTLGGTSRSLSAHQGQEAMGKGQQRRERTHPPPLPPRRDMYYDADGTGGGDIPRTESPPPPPLPPRHGESSVAGGGGGGGAGTGPSRSDARSPPLPSDTSGSPLKGSGRGAAATTGGVASQGDTTHSVSLSSSGVGAMAGPGPGGVATTAIGGRPTPSRRRDKNRSAGVLGDPHNLSSSSSPPQPSPRLIKGGFGTGAPQSWTGAAVAEATLAAASRKRPVGGSASVGLKAGGDPGAGSASATMVVAAGAGGAGSGVPTATSASDHRTPGRTRTGSAASGGTPSNSAGLAGVGASTRKHQRAVSGGVVPSAAPAPVPRIATSASPSTSRRSARVTATGGSGASGAQSAGGTAVTVGGAAVTAGARAAGAGSGSARASGAGAGGGAGGHAAGAAVVNATGAGVAAAAGASEGVAAAAGGTGGTGAAAPAAGSAPAGSGWIAVAKYEYMAQGPEQLSFRVGDIVQLHTDKVNAKGWGLGQANGKVGWFPADFVEMRPKADPDGKNRPSAGEAGATRPAASRNRRSSPPSSAQNNAAPGASAAAGAGGPAGGSVAAAGGGRGAPPPPPYPGRNQRGSREPSAGGGGGGGAGARAGKTPSAAGGGGRPEQPPAERERVRGSDTPGREPEQLPEHVFAIQMAKNQPWRDRLTPGGKMAYDDLLAFFKASRMVLDFNEIELKSVIGSGAFATVFRGIYRYKVGQRGEPDKKMEVAVKKLVGGGGGPMEKTLKDFKTECVLLSRLKHRNIIALVGATTHPVTCVMQYCSRGNLMVLLDDRSVDLSWKMKRQMMLDVATGMQYLHCQNPVIIHRDLKSLNVLIDENWVTKVTDFGLSRFKATSVSEKMTGQAGTYHWMAPEVINSQHYTEKADVFSYGIILWEIFTRAIPYGGMQPVQVVAAVLGRRERPRIPSRCPQALSQLMQACWAHDPDQRPCFDDVVPWLESL